MCKPALDRENDALGFLADEPQRRRRVEQKEAEVEADTDDDSDDPNAGNRPSEQRAMSFEHRLANKALAKLYAGHVSRSLRTLQEKPLAELTPETIAKLCALHPQATTPLPPLPAAAPTHVVVDMKTVRRISQRMCDGASPGVSGWTHELLHVLLDEDVCAEGISALILDIGNGDISVTTDAGVWLRCAVEVLVPKPDGGVRPLAIGEAIKKLAEAYFMSLVPLDKLLPSIQLGVGVPAGVDVAVHMVQAAMELRVGGANTIAINHDVTNAFNNISRAAVANALFDQPESQPIWRLFHWQHGAEALLLTFNGSQQLHTAITSEQGVQQGSSVSAAAFALAVQPAYERALQSVAVPAGALVATAILDDFTVVGAPSTASKSRPR